MLTLVSLFFFKATRHDNVIATVLRRLGLVLPIVRGLLVLTIRPL